jgi:hypothetical protein
MAWLRDGRVALWDWERFATGVPVGFDALHFRLQALLLQRGAVPSVAPAFTTDCDAVAICGGATPETARAVVALYAAELAARYLTLAQEPDGAPLARRAAWVLGFLETCAARL